jgi:hypothetical protein
MTKIGADKKITNIYYFMKFKAAAIKTEGFVRIKNILGA